VLLSSPAVDAAIVVARRGVSTRDGIRRARRILDRHLMRPLGVVVNGTADTGQYDYGYTQGSVDWGRTGTGGAAGRGDIPATWPRLESPPDRVINAGKPAADHPAEDPRRAAQLRADQLGRAERASPQSRKSGG
jgi:Mrp family chromosome partitioning ATPase